MGNCPVETYKETSTGAIDVTRSEVDRARADTRSMKLTVKVGMSESEANVTTSGKKLTCSSNVTSKELEGIVTVASADFLSVINATATKNECYAVLFYARWCHFSARAAPAFNALSRAIPQLRQVAVDLSEFSL